MNFRYLYTAAFLLCFAAVGAAQSPVFKSYPTKELGNERMQVVFQDHKGWMWFGGSEGLYRFDGFSFQPVALPDSVGNTRISAIGEFQQTIWIGFKNGAVCTVPANAVVPVSNPEIPLRPTPAAARVRLWAPEEGTPAKAITGFMPDKRGNLWIATYGEGLYCWTQKRLYQFNAADDGLLSDDIYDLACDAQGVIWAATDAGISRCELLDNAQKSVRNLGIRDGLPDEIILSLEADYLGNIWIGTYDKGVCQFQVSEQKLYFPTAQWSGGPVNSMAAYGKQELWLGTQEKGLVRYDIHTGVYHPVNPADVPFKTKITQLLKDREGLLWCLTDKGAVYSANIRFSILRTPFRQVQALLTSDDGKIWAGSQDGLFVYDERKGFRSVLPGRQNVLSLWKSPEGNIWAGTFGNGVFILNNQGDILQTLHEKNGLPNGSILSINGTDAKVWLATLGGVTLLETSRGRITAIREQHELGKSYAFKVFVDSKKRVWFGTDGNGLYMLENDAFTHYETADGISLKSIYSIAESADGHIWFSMDKNGLFRFDGRSFKHYTTQHHLHGASIASLVSMPGNLLLAAYEDGIDLLQTQTDHIGFFDSNAGLPNAEFTLNAAYCDPGGQGWLGTHEGIVRIASYDEAFVIDPQTALTSVSVFLEPFDFFSQAEFSYDRNYFIFHFTGLWFTHPESVRYRYRLDGFSPNWTISKDHLASYPNLPPGHYKFRVQASEHGLFEGTPEAVYTFVIHPPFWSSWWFMALCFTGVVLLLYYFIHAREQRLQKEASLRRETVVSQFEVLKSQINPHFLFNSFNTLITIIEENPKIAVEYVEHLADFYRSVMVYREKDLITIQEELEIVRNFDFLLKKRYENSFSLHSGINGHEGMIVPFALQILVENAVKHNVISKAKPLLVEIFIENNEYVVVRNNLQKKIKPEPSTGFGLQSLFNRYQLIGAKTLVVEESAASFTVKIPLLKNTGI